MPYLQILKDSSIHCPELAPVVHHARAKTLLRFALFYANDDELVEKLKNPCLKANDSLLKEAVSAITNARKHLGSNGFTREMYLTITEAKISLIKKEYEESAKAAKIALQLAYQVHSKTGDRGDKATLQDTLSARADKSLYRACISLLLYDRGEPHYADHFLVGRGRLCSSRLRAKGRNLPRLARKLNPC